VHKNCYFAAYDQNSDTCLLRILTINKRLIDSVVLFAYFYLISPGAVFRNNVNEMATVKSKDDSRVKCKSIAGHFQYLVWF